MKDKKTESEKITEAFERFVRVKEIRVRPVGSCLECGWPAGFHEITCPLGRNTYPNCGYCPHCGRVRGPHIPSRTRPVLDNDLVW